MRKLKTIILIALMMSAIWPSSSMAKGPSLNQLERFNNVNFKPTELFFDLDTLETQKILRMYYKGGDLLKGDKYPLNLKAEVYVFRDDSDKKVLAIFNKTIKSNKSTRNVILKSKLDLIKDGDRLFVDLYDSDNKLYGSYYHEQVNLSVATLSDAEFNTEIKTIEELDCKADSTDPECWIEFFFKNVNFVASYDKRLITEVVRNKEGGYNVLLPIKQGRKLKKKVGKFNVNGSGNGTGNGDNNNFFTNLEQGYYPFFNTVKDTVAAIQYIEGEGISFNVNEGNTAFTVLDSGLVKLAETSLASAPPENGVLEFDGGDIYYTAGGVRNLLSYDSSEFIDLSNGGYAQDTIYFVQNGKLQDAVFNGTLTFLEGTAPGYILTSGVNGQATWEDPASILANGNFSGINITNSSITNSTVDNSSINNSSFANGNILHSNFTNGNVVNSIVDNSSFTNGDILHSNFTNGNVVNSNIDNSSFTNGTVSSTTINNSILNNGYFQDPTINGRALFTSNSQIVINGGLLINGGSNNFVLTSDAAGNATWQPIPSSADNLGSHIAGQNLNLNGFSLINAQDINGVTANFVNGNFSTVIASDFMGGNFNGSFFGDGSGLYNLNISNGVQSNVVINNGYLQDPTINGKALFTTNSTSIFNGQIVITGGNLGDVLTSDVNGLASWQSLSASVSNGTFNNVTLQNSLVNNSNVTNSFVDNSSIDNSSFANGNILHSSFNSGNVVNSFIDNSSFANGNILHSSFTNGNVVNSDIDNSNFANGNILHSDFTNGNVLNSSIDNSSFTNGTVSNTTINNSMLNNGYFQDPTINGRALFTTNSQVVINGGLLINGGSNNFVLTSDAAGNATWQPIPSSADNLGSHIAGQDLNLNGFSLINAQDINGITANFANGNFNTINTVNINTTGFGFFSGSSNLQINGGLTIPTGAGAGRVLTSDAAGNATWVVPGAGADDMGNHAAAQAVNMNGFTLYGADQVNGATANFTTVNSTDLNTTNQTSTGFALFDTASNAQFNGGVAITTGAGAGLVLTSDATGNATWIDPATLASNGDDLGNHNATEALVMSGFSITNADQVNGATANFTTVNSTNTNTTNQSSTGFALFGTGSTIQMNGTIAIPTGAAAGRVLTSDATGNATWVAPGAGADNMGNHAAAQAVNMNGFTLFGADQVNGATANFTTVNATTGAITSVNSTNVNTTNQSSTGFALFDTGSTIQMNGTIAIPTGAAAGRVLTSDAAGNATWVAPGAGADHMGNHIARQAIDMNGFSLFNADQVNGATANFTTVNATTGAITSVNSTNVNTTNQSSTGFALFDTGSTIQMNGTIAIPTGAAAGRVLTSDAAGNATWVAPGAGADHMGNHIARQAIDMNGFSLFNADQVNGNTGNFTDTNVLGSAFFGNASDIQVNGTLMIQPGAAAGRVLTSDASGNATWQAPGAGADHMGNHIARQAIDMNGFSLFNADQVNGNTGNFANTNVTGTAFFGNASDVQVNGGLIIQAGAINGHVLATDAAGNARWQNLSLLIANNPHINAGEFTENGPFGFIYPSDYSGAQTLILGAQNIATADIILGKNGNATFNEQAFDSDFRIESAGNPDMFFMDAGQNRIIIGGNSAPEALFEVGNGTASQLVDAQNGMLVGGELEVESAIYSDSLNTNNIDLANFALFGPASTVRFNGTVNIPAGAAAGRVLTSDASGNATWQPAGSGADHMGNHIARQAIDMNGFTLFNADQVNGNVANFADANVTGSTFFGNASDVQMNGTLMIQPGAAAGRVLTSDASGNATWQPAGSGADHMGNHIARQAIDMNGFSLFNSDQINGASANFNNLSLTSGYGFFNGGTTAQFNGTINIPTGASSNFVLTSDAAGNATWQDLSSLPSNGDDLGNHTATQALAMAGFSLTNADQVNGNVANFADANLTGSTLFGNASDVQVNGTLMIQPGAAAGRVLTSDASGNATWQPAGSGADHMGNHIARQAIDMNGFSLFNADQINGASANFNNLSLTSGYGFFNGGTTAQFNGTINIPTGAAAGRVLTSDASGNATWQPAGSGADHMGNHIARQAIDMNGFSLTNADQVNGNVANFADANVTGSTFFGNASDVQVNGTLMIQPGAAAGRVLTSDASGNATWQPAGSGADHMGNHIARQAIDMNGFSLFNADQINGASANFNNLSLTSGYGFFNGGTTAQFNGTINIPTGASLNFVLTSDAAGNATWQNLSSLPSNGDNLGNHAATQALAMAGFSLTNADQVNGVTANFSNGNFTNEVNANLILNDALHTNASAVGVTVDWNNGNRQVITMAHNVTFTFTAPSSAGVGAFTILLKQDATGSRLATWPAAVLWPSGVAPTLTTTANAVDIVSCMYDGTNYYCQLGADFR